MEEAPMKRLLTFAAVLVLAVVASGLLLAQNNPSIGTWKLNLTKSKYSPGPPPKSQTGTYEAAGNGVKVTVEGIAGDGSKSRIAIRPTTTARITL
jgi:hypothetical protein